MVTDSALQAYLNAYQEYQNLLQVMPIGTEMTLEEALAQNPLLAQGKQNFETLKATYDNQCDSIVKDYLEANTELILNDYSSLKLGEDGSIVRHFTTTEDTANWIPEDSGRMFQYVTGMREKFEALEEPAETPEVEQPAQQEQPAQAK